VRIARVFGVVNVPWVFNVFQRMLQKTLKT